MWPFALAKASDKVTQAQVIMFGQMKQFTG